MTNSVHKRRFSIREGLVVRSAQEGSLHGAKVDLLANSMACIAWTQDAWTQDAWLGRRFELSFHSQSQHVGPVMLAADCGEKGPM
eukprot:scaffold271_cov336-Pavlova_lutheri.AAC.14